MWDKIVWFFLGRPSKRVQNLIIKCYADYKTDTVRRAHLEHNGIDMWQHFNCAMWLHEQGMI